MCVPHGQAPGESGPADPGLAETGGHDARSLAYVVLAVIISIIIIIIIIIIIRLLWSLSLSLFLSFSLPPYFPPSLLPSLAPSLSRPGGRAGDAVVTATLQKFNHDVALLWFGVVSFQRWNQSQQYFARTKSCHSSCRFTQAWGCPSQATYGQFSKIQSGKMGPAPGRF